MSQTEGNHARVLQRVILRRMPAGCVIRPTHGQSETVADHSIFSLWYTVKWVWMEVLRLRRASVLFCSEDVTQKWSNEHPEQEDRVSSSEGDLKEKKIYPRRHGASIRIQMACHRRRVEMIRIQKTRYSRRPTNV